MFQLEVAYSSVLRSADAALSLWQERVSSGKTIVSFGQRVGLLKDDVLSHFQAETVGLALVRERGERLRQLSEHVLKSSRDLHQQQVAIATEDAVRAFKKRLADIAAVDSSGLVTVPASAGKDAVDESLLAYRTRLSKLDGGEMLLTQRGRTEELSLALETLLKDFSGTSAARLAQMRRLVHSAAKSVPTTGGARRGLSPIITLVGMLRFPGAGNLNGIIGFATRLLGVPLDLQLGVDNNSGGGDTQVNAASL